MKKHKKAVLEFTTIKEIHEHDLNFLCFCNDLEDNFYHKQSKTKNLYLFKSIMDRESIENSLLPNFFGKNEKYVKGCLSERALTDKELEEFEITNLISSNRIYAVGDSIEKPLSFLAVTVNSDISNDRLSLNNDIFIHFVFTNKKHRKKGYSKILSEIAAEDILYDINKNIDGLKNGFSIRSAVSADLISRGGECFCISIGSKIESCFELLSEEGLLGIKEASFSYDIGY